MAHDPALVSTLTSIAAVAMPEATRSEILVLVDRIAGAYELVGGTVRPGGDAHALQHAHAEAPALAAAIACHQAGRGQMSAAERTLADLRARGIDPSDLFDSGDNGEDVLFDEVDRRFGGGGEAA